jgi:hypothetical protein
MFDIRNLPNAKDVISRLCEEENNAKDDLYKIY